MASNNSPFVKPAHQVLVKGDLCLVSLLALPAKMISAGTWCVDGLRPSCLEDPQLPGLPHEQGATAGLCLWLSFQLL